MAAKIFTADELSAYVARQFEADAPEVIRKINAWLARGDGVAVYENCDLGAKDAGASKIMSYGSGAAQLEPFCGTCGEALGRTDVHGSLEFVHSGDEPADGHVPVYPPANLPDTPSEINWRYQLYAVYRDGAQVGVPEVPGQAGEALAYARYLNTHGYTATVWRYQTALDNYGAASRRTRYAAGYAVKYDGQLIRNDGSRAEYPSKGLQVFCEEPAFFAGLVSSGRALVAGPAGYVPMYVASYNPRETEAQRNPEVNPGTCQTVNLHDLGPSDVAPEGPHRFFDLILTQVPVS